MGKNVSPLERARAAYRPKLPEILAAGIDAVGIEETGGTGSVADPTEIRTRFPRTFGRPVLRFVKGTGPEERTPLTVGVVLSGGQAPGGHNVIAGLFDALKAIHPDSRLLGFAGGPKGVLTNDQRELTAEEIEPYRNTGGFDLLRSGRDKIETEAQLEASRTTCENLQLDGLVVIGGDDSNTNAAVLAEYFLDRGLRHCVVGVPKTIDGDLKGEQVEASFGFDTACRLYSELIGNVSRDAKSAGKYWHFIKLMGRSTSHVALECAFQTHANITLIGEEVSEKQLTLREIVDEVAEIVRRRAKAGLHHGVCLVPEGLIEFIPEIRVLIEELNRCVHDHSKYFETIPTFFDKQEFVNQKLSKDSSYVFSALPVIIQTQLLLDRDSHGNVQVSKIDTEQLLVEKVTDRIAEWQVEGSFPGKFQVQNHFLGYEGRCSPPSNFDADYTYGLGYLAAALTAFRRTGYICGLRDLVAPTAEWRATAVPLTSMMQMEVRKGRPTPVIAKALVDTGAEPFRHLAAHRRSWQMEDDYLYPGPIQYFGPSDVSETRTITLRLERGPAARADTR